MYGKRPKQLSALSPIFAHYDERDFYHVLARHRILIAACPSHMQCLDLYLPAHHIHLNLGYNTEQHLE